MPTKRLILETDEWGNLKQDQKLPPNKRVEVIILDSIEHSKTSGKRRTPHPDLAGKIIIKGNIFDSVSSETFSERTPGIVEGAVTDAFFEPLPEEELKAWDT